MNKYLRLPNGNKINYYNLTITNSLIVKFVDADIKELKNFFGTDIIDYVDIVDDDNNILESHTVYMKRTSILTESSTIINYEDRIVKEAWTEVQQTIDSETGESKEITIDHPAEIEKIAKEKICDITTVILEKPSLSEEIDNVKNAIGIVNTNNMTLDEFKNYYKTLIGKSCTLAIESGLDVETSKGIQHFSYTIEDQSNIKDLVMTAELTNFTLPLPYHADGELCNTYQPTDILNIYMSLSSNKTYHTTYCNILNAMILEAKDMETIKGITYGMEITDEKYTDVMKKINESKDALLAYVAKSFESKKSE